MAKKLGLALGSGGSRGIAHIGFLKALEEAEIKVDFLTGSSMGAVIGACYAFGLSPDEMLVRAKKLKFRHVCDISFRPIGNGGLLRSKKMYKQIKKIVGDSTFNSLKTPFKCVSVDLCTGEKRVFGDDYEVAKCVSASSSIPGIFRPVEIDGGRFIDGGTKCRVPLQEAYDMGAEVVIGIDVLGATRPMKDKFNVFTVLFRAFEMMDRELSVINERDVKPDLFFEVDIGDMSQYKFKGLDRAYEAGYKLGKENIEKIKELIR